MTADTTTRPPRAARPASRAPRPSAPLAATAPLTRLALRRDRFMIPAWVLGLSVMVVTGASSIAELYDTPESRAGLAESMGANSSLRALYGQMYDATTTGGLTAWRFGALGCALAGLMGILLVVRHTRDEEETGRLELVSSAAVGRRAPLTAALATAWGAALALGLLIAAALTARGEAAAGSAALGLSFTGSAAVFAALAAVTAQLTETGRAARSLAGAGLGLAFLLRAAGDGAGESGPSWLAWLSPLGWPANLRPYAGERWWTLLLTAALTAALTALAYTLVARRDHGAGILPDRPGPADAPPYLRSPLGLALRLHRGSLYGWAAGFAVAGLVFGSISDGASDLVGDNADLAEILRRMGGAARMEDTFLATMVSMLAMIASVYAVQAVSRMRGEETSGRAEPVLAGAVHRVRWAAGHLAFAAAGSLALLLVAGAAMGLGYGAASGDIGGQVPRLVGAALVCVPAVWFMASVAAVLFGALPGQTSWAWGATALALLTGLYGPVLDLPQPVLNLSPFTHLPQVPAEDVTAAPLLVLALAGAALTALGLRAFRRRDIG